MHIANTVLGPTMVAHGTLYMYMYVSIRVYIHVQVMYMYRVMYCVLSRGEIFFVLINFYELNLPMLVYLKIKKLWPSGIRFVNIK